MFVGQYEHTLDDKGRVVLPPDFREELGQRAYVVRLGERLGLWDEATYAQVSADWEAHRKSGTLDAVSFRKLTSETQRVKIDSAGRITINKSLLEGFSLGQTVVLSGALSRIEIWPQSIYSTLHDTAEASANVQRSVGSDGLLVGALLLLISQAACLRKEIGLPRPRSVIGCFSGFGEGYFCPTTPPVTPQVRSGRNPDVRPASEGQPITERSIPFLFLEGDNAVTPNDS